MGLTVSGHIHIVAARLFYRIAGCLNGWPPPVIVEEGWLALSDPGVLQATRSYGGFAPHSRRWTFY